jgi:transposase
METTVAEPRSSNADIAQRIKDIFGQNHSPSPSLISIVRHRMGFLYKPPKCCQHLTEIQKEARTKFAATMLMLGNLTNIIFTDECRFALTSDNHFIWRRRVDKNEHVFANKSKFPYSCMFFGGIGIDIKSTPVFVEKNEDAAVYIETIEKSGLITKANQKFGEGGWVMMEDGAPAHRSKLAIQAHKSKFNRMNIWPANSCDLNPIEHFWGAIKKLLSLCYFTSKDELKEEITKIWLQFSQETINRLVFSFNSRIVGIYLKNGESISDELRSNIRYFDKYRIETEITDEIYEKWYDPLDLNATPVEIEHKWKEEEEHVLLYHMLYHKRGPSKAAKELKIALVEFKKHLKIAIEDKFRVVAETSSYFKNFQEASKNNCSFDKVENI